MTMGPPIFVRFPTSWSRIANSAPINNASC